MRVNATMLVVGMALLSVARLGAADDLRLVEAVKNQDKLAARTLLRQGLNVDTPQPDGATALHWAAHWADVEMADLLIRAGAHVNVTNDYQVTPLALACADGNAPMVETLLKAGADPNTRLLSGETPLMTAARTGSVDAVKALLARGANVHAKETLRGQTPLMWAAAEGHAGVVQVLIENGADVRARSTAGSTALLLVARVGDLRTTQLLLGAGVPVDEAAPDGTTALLIATIRGHLSYATFLLDQGANPNSGPGFTPLHWAAGEWPTELTGFTTGILAEDNEWSPLGGLRGAGKLEFVKVLLAHGADPNLPAKATPRYGDGPGESAANAVGSTPFLMAAKAGDAAVMRVLATAGADPLATTPQKTTAVMLAANLGGSVDYWLPESSYLEAVRLALELGVDVDAANAAGDTALHVAALRGSTTFIQALLEHGANVNARDKYGWTPLTLTEGVSTNGDTRFPAAAEALLEAGATPTPPGIERNAAKIQLPRP